MKMAANPDTRAVVIAPQTADDAQLAAIVRTLEAAGVQVITADTLRGPLWADSLIDALRAADIVVADITKLNPNVMYELGFAHALGKRTFLLMDKRSRQSIPFDLAGTNIAFYDRLNFERVVAELGRTVRRIGRRAIGSE